MLEPLRGFGELKEWWDAERKAENREAYQTLLRLGNNVLRSKDTVIEEITFSRPDGVQLKSIDLTVTLRQGTTQGGTPRLEFTLLPDSTLHSKSVRDRKYVERLATVLKHLLNIGSARFWEKSDLRIFTKASEQAAHGGGGGRGGLRKRGIDYTRLENLRELLTEEGALCGFYLNELGEPDGFPEYVCVVFPHHVVLENTNFDHAIYLRDIPPLDLRGCHLSHPVPWERVPQKKRNEIKEILKPYLPLALSKEEYSKLPDVEIVRHQGEWQKQLRGVLGRGRKRSDQAA